MKSVSVAVVIPLYRQSQYLTEAVHSVLSQSVYCGVVIVNDGCPDDLSETLGIAFSESYPERCIYIRQKNLGLSGARNSGIRVAIAAWPSIESILFLDADDFISPTVLEKMREKLTIENADFVFPQLNRFGEDFKVWRVPAHANLYRMLFQNHCAATSLVRRSVFDVGLYFDETMRDGYEDWEFFIRVLNAGFLGVCDGDTGVMYRVKQHSMLRDSLTKHAEIVGRIHTKHSRLLESRGLALIEHNWAPRFKWISMNSMISQRNFTCPDMEDGWLPLDSEYRPPVNFIASEDCWEILKSANLLVSVLLMSQALVKDGIVSYQFKYGDNLNIEKNGGQGHHSVLISYYGGFSEYGDRSKTTESSILSELVGKIKAGTRNFSITVPRRFSDRAPAPLTEAKISRGISEFWKNGDFVPKDPPTPVDISEATTRRFSWERNCVAMATTNLFAEQSQHVCIVSPWMRLGGVDLCVMNTAAEIRRLRPDVILHLVLTSSGFEFAHDAIQYFHHIYPIGSLPWDLRVKTFHAITSTMNVVVNANSELGYSALRSQRREDRSKSAAKHVCYLHAFDQHRGEQVGYPITAAKQAHTFDGCVVISENLRSFLINEGVSPSKIQIARNAPVVAPHSLDDANALAIAKSRRQSAKLKLLFAGRADFQKGIVRLQIMAQRLIEIGVEFELLFVGDSVLDAENVCWPKGVVRTLPATEDRAVLRGYYEDADIFVMLSRWEGIPLSLLDAMACGCVCVTTDVGAINELIETGTNGFLINDGEDQTVGEIAANSIVEILDARDKLEQLRLRAVATAFSYSWEGAAKVFLSFLDSRAFAGTGEV